MPLVGTRLGPYEILAPLGAGGMGEVYRARDPRLGREVAIKVLPDSVARDPARLQRFEQEARLVAALSHPNILAIFDVGTGERPYLVTELLEGETLRALLNGGALAPSRALDLALQLTAGLNAAHGRGIVHRDLKPENIFLTRDRLVKILDFGLAKGAAAGTVEGGLDETRPGLTMPGVVMGTAGYMAPEQIRGRAADPRSDIFAVGAVLYEMLTGRRAFPGDSPADTASAVLREQPPDVGVDSGVPPALWRIVQRCLEKAPGERFQTVADLRFALESMSDTRPAQKPADEKSIAVLPFANMSADAENQYFSDGLAEELINALVRLPGLRVAARTSAFRFRDNSVDIREIGRQLHVTTVLEGSVRRAGNRLRVTAQLINIADGYHLWSERYDRELADVFAIQDEIVESIVKALAPALAGEAKAVVRRPTENLEAYQLYLQGRHWWHQRSPNSLQSAIRCFEQVIALDADYALAYAGLADCYAILRVYGWYPAAKCRPPAQAAIARALALDSSLADVHLSQALFTYYFDPHWRRAEDHLRRALAINPRLAGAQAYLGLVLSSQYRVDEAVAAADKAIELDPLSAFIHYLGAALDCVVGRFESGERRARRILELQPDAIMGLWPLAFALSGTGQHVEAIAAGERAVMLSRAPFYTAVLGMAYARGGRDDAAESLIRELDERAARGEYVTPAALLMIHAARQDVDAVRATLRCCVDDETPPLSIQLSSPLLEPMRKDAEIEGLLDRLYDGARMQT